MPAYHFPEMLTVGSQAVSIRSADLALRTDIPESGILRSPDVKGRFTVLRRSETVDVREIAHMVPVYMGQKYLVHLAHRYSHGVILGYHARSAVKYELIHAACFYKDAVAFLRDSWDNGGPQKGDPHLIRVQLLPKRKNGQIVK